MERTIMCKVPRCYSAHICNADELQMLIFADANESAFAAVAYFRVTHLGQNEIRVSKLVMWTDSMTVLRWI